MARRYNVPSDPRKAPKSHGKKPPAPRPHSSSGSSGKPGPAVSIIALAIFGLPFLAFLGSLIAVILRRVQ